MFKSKSSRLARRRQQQQQQQREEAEAARLAALPKQDYLDNCHRTYSCIHCRAHLASHDELLSKLFQGNHGRAYLFNRVVNIGCRRAITRELLTGLHAVCDIYCKTCETTLGWKYETAFVASQKYKEGKFIIELVHMIKENNSDPSSFARVKQLFHGVSRQQVPAYEHVYQSLGATDCPADWAPPTAQQQLQQQQQQQQPTHTKKTTRNRSSSSISSIYRNGPTLASTTRLRAPSTPAATAPATCAGREEVTQQGEHVASESTNYATENEILRESHDDASPTSASTISDNNNNTNGREVQPTSCVVVVVVGGGGGNTKESPTHRNRRLISSSPALNSLAPTGGPPARGSSEGSSQLSSSSASSNSLTIECQTQAGDK